MRFSRPVSHNLGNLIHIQKVEFNPQKKVIYLYKAVSYKDGRYFNIFGDETEYFIGKTMKRTSKMEDHYYVGVRKLVSLVYFSRLIAYKRVLKVEVPISACYFPARIGFCDDHTYKFYDNYIPNELRVNKFTPIEDVTPSFTRNFKFSFDSKEFKRRLRWKRKKYHEFIESEAENGRIYI